MKRGPRMIGLAAAVALGAALLCFALRPQEPVFEGRRLTDWLQRFSLLQPQDTEDPEQQAQEAARAVRQIGTQEALPTLLKMLQARDSPLKQTAMALVAKQSIVSFRFVPAEDVRFRAVQAFGALGASAASATPALVGLLGDPKVGQDAALALAKIGDSGLTALRAALTNQNPAALKHSLAALRTHDPCLEISVPALLRCAQHTSPSVRLQGVMALTAAGSKAKSAAPVLMKLLDLANPSERAMLTQAVWSIDPDTATRAWIKRPE